MADEPKKELTRAERLYRLRHSAAHIMAQAVLEMFPDGKVAIGPPIQDGFYYDFDLPRPLTDEDLAEIEVRMKRIVDGNHPFRHSTMPRADARKYFEEHGQSYKAEIIDRIKDDEVSIYQHDSFVDLCAGPHVRYSKECKNFKLLSVAGAYWRGDSSKPMLQRIYGTVWQTKDDLEQYLQLREEGKRRDHRKLGKELDLFWFHPWAPGSAFWKPKGTVLYQTLEDHWRKSHRAAGYVEIRNPVLYNKELFETSGHWDHYKDNMFVLEAHGQTYALKPMNCPDTMLYYKSEKRSYRDLPMRISEGGLLHRNELPGAMSGLTRVRQFQIDDAHIFVRAEQLAEEVGRVIAIIDQTYSMLGLELKMFLATRPESFMGDPEVWDRAEAGLKQVLDASGRPWQLNAGDGAFYGPKIDFQVRDSLGRSWQTATVQADFQLPLRFELEYIGADNKPAQPVVIHRAVYGSLERFIAILVEHFGGHFPTWLSPIQARVMAVTDDVNDYAHEVGRRLREHEIRMEVDDRSEKIGYKIREAEMQKVPYMLVVGGRDREAGVVDVRSHLEGRRGTMTIDAVVEEIRKKIAEKTLDVKLQKVELWKEEDVVANKMEETGY